MEKEQWIKGPDLPFHDKILSLEGIEIGITTLNRTTVIFSGVKNAFGVKGKLF